MEFSLVVATDQNRGIGINGTMPWQLKADMKYFRELTSHTQNPKKVNAVIMGRTTWLSIPEKFRPLPKRLNIVLSTNSSLSLPDGVYVASSLEMALKIAEEANVENCFVIGGGKVYQEAVKSSKCKNIFLTEIHNTYNCDTFFPEYRNDFEKKSSTPIGTEDSLSYQFNVYARIFRR